MAYQESSRQDKSISHNYSERKYTPEELTGGIIFTENITNFTYLCAMKKFLQKPFKYSLTKNILLIIGILVVGYVIINLFLRIITRHNQELTVPDMTGMNLAEASAVAAEADLRLEVTDSVYIRGMERGAIARQNPEPGGKVKKNRRILLVINSVIPRQSTMPSLTGFSLRQARTELASNGLNIGKLIYVNDMATDNVLAQQYMGEDIEPGTRATRWPPSCCMTTP